MKDNVSRKMKRRAIFYTLDALLASMLLLTGVLLLYANYNPDEGNVEQQTFLSQDTLTVLSELKVYELNNSFVLSEIASGNITDVNKSALDQIGEYWALNHVDKAQELLAIIINNSLSPEYGVKTSMGNNTLLIQNLSRKVNSISSNRMIAGIEQGKPLTGSSGTSYLKKIRNKKTSSYTYFGGFVGQGNITLMLELPVDFNRTRLADALMKLETPGTFQIYINDIPCGTSYSGTVGQVSSWDIVSCNSSFKSGVNYIRLNFISVLNVSYVSGGFIKATYTTDTLIENLTSGYYRYYFPDINGFINFYDVLSVQGNIINWTLNATFYNPYDTLFRFGNDTLIWTQGNFTGNQTIVYSRTNQALAQEPIPIRFSVTNFSNISTILYGVPGDIFMITDVSGSMDYTATNYSIGCIGQGYNCSYLYRKVSGGTYTPISCIVSNPSACQSPNNPCGASPFYSGKTYDLGCNVSKLMIAKNASNNFIDNITSNSTLYKIGLVDFSTRANTMTPLTNNLAILHNEINGYVAGGSTCTCCALNRARNSIITSGNMKFMILLSDGEPNVCCSSLNDYSGGSCGPGANNPINWSIKAGREACNNNITVFTIGFGNSMSDEGRYAMQQIACNPTYNSSNATANASNYYSATNTTDLEEAFKNITRKMMVAANFSSQTVTVAGNFTNSRLFGSSYIDVHYIPLFEGSEQSKISLVTESTQFNGCNAMVAIPPNVEISDAFVTSYSSNHWTSLLTVNGVVVFNLSKYGSEYKLLGDPFIIQVPSSLLIAGAYNNISLEVGDSQLNHSNCSNNNTLIYTALVNVSTGRTDALEQASGCKWSVQSISGTTFNVTVPKDYSGLNHCYYTNSSIAYNHLDVYDTAVYSMLKQLDYANNGMIFFDLEQNDFEIILITTGQVAYMWGPSLMKIEVWQ